MDAPFPNPDELQKAHRLCRALNNIMVLINATLDPDELMNRVVVETAKGIGCDSARIALREGERWIVRHTYQLPQDAGDTTFTDEDLPHAALAMITRKPVVVEDAFNDSRANTDLMRNYGIRSMIVLPLMDRRKVTGTLFFNYHSQTTFDRAEVEFAENVANAVAIALQNALLFREQERIMQDLEEEKRLNDVLNEIEGIIYSSLDTAHIMGAVLRKAAKAIGAESAMIFALDDSASWVVRHVYRLSASLVGRRFSNDLVKHTAITAQTKQPMAVNDTEGDARVHPGFVSELQIRSLLDFPLIVKSKVIGDLVFHYHSRPAEFTPYHIAFVSRLQNSISLALENAKLFEALKESESQLRESEQLARFGHFHYDRRSGRMKWSEGLFAIFGRDPNVKEPSIDELFSDHCLEPDCNRIKELVVREERSEFDITISSARGPMRLHILVHSLKDERGNTTVRLGTVHDVTDQKKAEEGLRESEAFKQGILDALLEHIAVLDQESTIIAVNSRWTTFAETNGMAAEQKAGLGMNYLALCRKSAELDDPLARQALEGIEAVLEGRTDKFFLEYPCHSPDEERWFLMEVVRPRPEFRGAVISHRAITERKRMEEQLRQSRALSEATVSQLEAVIGSMNDALIISDLHGNIQKLNKSAMQLYGFLSHEDGKRNLAEYALLLELSDMNGNVLSMEEWPMMRAIRGEQFTNRELRVRSRATGHTFIGNYSGTPVRDNDGDIILALLTIRDVTEYKQAEEALRISEENYRTIFDSASDAIYIHDPETGRILDVNEKMLELCKVTKEEALRMTVMDVTGDPNVTEEDVIRLIHGATDEPQVFDWLGKDREGRLFWVEVSLKKVVLQGSDRVLAVVRDISDRKEAEENLKRVVDQLKRSNAELEQFAYTVSHDLQEPLRMVSSYMRLLEEKYGHSLDEKAHTYMHFALDGALRMHNLIEGLLKYSRISSSNFAWVDTNRVFRDATANLAAAVEETGAVVTAAELPRVWGDETLLLQLFQNLLSNGIKYGKKDEAPRVEVSAEETREGWKFTVRDNGIGIRQEDYGKVFQIFRRLHTQAEYPGTGIGLASCKKIVDQHHGRIWLHSVPGEGSAFFFTIPYPPEAPPS